MVLEKKDMVDELQGLLAQIKLMLACIGPWNARTLNNQKRHANLLTRKIVVSTILKYLKVLLGQGGQPDL